MGEREYKLEELAREAGTSARTVRYYVQRGLLPAPAFRGKDTAYGEEHLARLRAIRRLQEAYLPLDAIAVELEGRSTEELEKIAAGKGVAGAGRQKPEGARQKSGSSGRSGSGTGDEAEPELGVMRGFSKIAIAEGVEIVIANDAPPESRRLVERLLASLQATSRMREGR